MNRTQRLVRVLFATGMMSVGGLALVYGHSVLLFQDLPPEWLPWLRPVGVASGIVMLGTGAGLLLQRTARLSTRILLAFLLLWTLTRLPVVAAEPLREISWFAIGEVAVLFAAALVLVPQLAGLKAGSKLQKLTAEHGPTIARVMVGLSVVTFGLAHFFEFAARTVSLVPPWLPYPTAWADFTGAAQVAAGLGLVFAVYPRWAAAAEAAMLSGFAVLVWVPAVIAKSAAQSDWVEFLFTWALATACWVVAEQLPAAASSGSSTPAGPNRELYTRQLEAKALEHAKK